ncbi:MAG: DotU family type IV/VI secretion system protein [Byssovorax sp.]
MASRTQVGKAGGPLGLVDAFSAFYAESIRLKRLVVSSPQPPTVDTIKEKLLDLFEAQAAGVGRKLADYEIRVFQEAQYLMVAMADEVFLRLEWPGRSMWSQKPLESQIFRSHDAGERFFRRLDEVLGGRATASTEILTVYLTALALGFSGRYGGASPRPEEYRLRLSAHLARVDPGLVIPEPDLVPEAHEHTLSDQKRSLLPSFSAGIIPLIAVFVGWIVIAQVVWAYRTSEVDNQLDRIEGAAP